MNRPVPTVAMVVCALGVAACANIRFERGPYAIRDLEVVYSAQENLSFISWRLRKDARLPLVSFELWIDGEYVEITPEDAPFPAEPYECGESWCFQYQVSGELALPPEGSPMRSVHRDEGVYMGSAERFRRVMTTFDTDPIALGHNERIDPRRFDWFADNQVPLRRTYDWQFTEQVAGACGDPDADAWALADQPIPVAYEWTARAAAAGLCFHLRPAHPQSPFVTALLFPSAETSWETQKYVPARVDAPIVWGLLLDLEVPDATRCRQVKGVLIDMIEANIAARGEDIKLGIYTPVDSVTGAELDGCDQSPSRDYPLEQMLRDAQTASVALEPAQTRVLWIFANNIELPPSDRILDQLELFGLALLFGEAAGGGLEFPSDIEVPEIPDGSDDLIELGGSAYTWAIGSDVFMSLFPWNATTPWRPVEDDTLRADVRSIARSTLPFATMRHEAETQIEITPPPDADTRPFALKVCDATPFPVSAIGVDPEFPFYAPDQTVLWPEFDDTPPYYTVEIPPQILVPNREYVRRNEQVVVEVCTRFCAGPFRSRGGDDFDTWWSANSCQWNL